MKNKYRIIKILITVGLLVFLLSFSLKRFSNKTMDHVKINMTQNQKAVYFVDEKAIREIVKKTNPENTIGKLDIPKLENKIISNDFVDSANVYLDLNGTLNIDILQREPAFRLLKNGRDFYVDAKGVEFPISRVFSYPSMLVMGDVEKSEYHDLTTLIQKIEKDEFSKNYFIGISKEKGGYNLLTNEGNYKVEIGDLDNIDLKVKGFKTFVEKHLIYQDPNKYKKISVKYDNQIVATLNPYFKENDSVLRAQQKAITQPIVKAETTGNNNTPPVTEKPKPKTTEVKKAKKSTKNKTQGQSSQKEQPKKKAKVVVE